MLSRLSDQKKQKNAIKMCYCLEAGKVLVTKLTGNIPDERGEDVAGVAPRGVRLFP